MEVQNIVNLSYWERNTYFENIDFLIIGSGIVGLSCAINLKNRFPAAKVLVLERGYLPSGASSKNAGFACFGSVTELLDDIENFGETKTWQTVQKRYEGLQYLKSMVSPSQMDLQTLGSWDLIMEEQIDELEFLRSKLTYLNQKMQDITGEKDVFAEDISSIQKFGFKGVKTAFYNRLEGQINTGKMIGVLHQKAINIGVHCLYGIEIEALQSNLYEVAMQSNVGYIKARKVMICTNGFAKQFLPQYDVQPARAQVVVTNPIENLKFEGTFHYQKGYYYFRNIDGRILLGGGRNLNFEGEKTTDLQTTEQITNALKSLLKEVIIPNQEFAIDYQWAGIMGVGATKAPIVEKLNDRIGIAVRMGGMGVAIGSQIGKELAEMFELDWK